MSRNVPQDKLVKELLAFEEENCDHALTKKIRERMKAARPGKGVPIPEDFDQHFGCAKCCADFIAIKIEEGRALGLKDAVNGLVDFIERKTREKLADKEGD